MKIIISPAKKMNCEDSLPFHAPPHFLPEADCIRRALQALPPKALQALWNCNDAIAALNIQRLHSMALDRNLAPAILAYEGIQYQYMAPGVFEDRHFDYIDKHLRILSGFYGLLRPFDGATPYRLEMRAGLAVDGCTDLYAFWGRKLADRLCAETDLILNLASKEYSRAVTAHLPEGVRVISCVFAQWHNGRLIEKGTLCKMARGQMVRFLAEHNVTAPEDVKAFNQLGYAWAPAHSTGDTFVFIKD